MENKNCIWLGLICIQISLRLWPNVILILIPLHEIYLEFLAIMAHTNSVTRLLVFKSIWKRTFNCWHIDTNILFGCIVDTVLFILWWGHGHISLIWWLSWCLGRYDVINDTFTWIWTLHYSAMSLPSATKNNPNNYYCFWHLSCFSKLVMLLVK